MRTVLSAAMRSVKKTTPASSAVSIAYEPLRTSASIVNGRAMRGTLPTLVACLACAAAAPVGAGSGLTNGRRLSVGPGHLLVLTDPDLDRIAIFDVSGERPRKRMAFGERGSKPGQLDSPHGAAVTARGSLLVADTGNH